VQDAGAESLVLRSVMVALYSWSGGLFVHGDILWSIKINKELASF
jgi:hypothetical protein